jgi:hypothetical protein
MSQAITDASYIATLVFAFFIFLAGVGSLIGYLLAKKVRGKYMAISSAVYWAVYLINLYFVYLYSYHREGLYQIDAIYTLSRLVYFSGFLIPFLNLAYVITWYRLKN